jgi:7,8-dihydropterin-6-yl-methyl-4-(beta-D-ribofuranosyl)aminobenzene 5'-phosphate synthase
MSRQFELDFNEKPKWLTDRLAFLGSIPRNNAFEGQTSIGKVVNGDKIEDDFIIDDSALVYKATDGLVIITGCAHSGICNTIEYAKKVCNVEKILGVIGGFHLQNPDKKQLRETIEYFKELNPKDVYPCHCTDFKSKCALSSEVNVGEVGVGLQLEYA